MAHDTEIFERYVHLLEKFRQRLNPWLFSGEGCFGYDAGKLLLLMPEGLSGQEFESLLLSQAKVQIEMSGSRLALAMTSPADTEYGFEALEKGALGILGRCASAPAGAPEAPILPEMALLPRQAQAAACEKVSMQDAVGRVCLEYCATYPPGVPILCPGERVSEDAANQLIRMGKSVLFVSRV
jgi:lysine decarboxylase